MGFSAVVNSKETHDVPSDANNCQQFVVSQCLGLEFLKVSRFLLVSIAFDMMPLTFGINFGRNDEANEAPSWTRLDALLIATLEFVTHDYLLLARFHRDHLRGYSYLHGMNKHERP
jgi:hypothetical protein